MAHPTGYGMSPDRVGDLTFPQLNMLLSELPDLQREQAFHAARPLAGVFGLWLDTQGGKRPPTVRDGEEPEPPLEPHERYDWLEVLRMTVPDLLPEGLRDADRGIVPRDVAREFVLAQRAGWVPAWVAEAEDDQGEAFPGDAIRAAARRVDPPAADAAGVDDGGPRPVTGTHCRHDA